MTGNTTILFTQLKFSGSMAFCLAHFDYLVTNDSIDLNLLDKPPGTETKNSLGFNC